jgi:molybdopterin converting factor subunit 1
MTLTVHLFGRARELAGSPRLEVACEAGVTVGQLRGLLEPALGSMLERCAMAVNHEFASDDRLVTAGDEVAVIPPVSGG